MGCLVVVNWCCCVFLIKCLNCIWSSVWKVKFCLMVIIFWLIFRILYCCVWKWVWCFRNWCCFWCLFMIILFLVFVCLRSFFVLIWMSVCSGYWLKLYCGMKLKINCIRVVIFFLVVSNSVCVLCVVLLFVWKCCCLMNCVWCLILFLLGVLKSWLLNWSRIILWWLLFIICSRLCVVLIIWCLCIWVNWLSLVIWMICLLS